MRPYGAKIVEYMEEKGLCLLQKIPGYEGVARNNLIIATHPDYIVGSRLGDCQYSGDFLRFGDVRLDFISAYDDTGTNYQLLQKQAMDRVGSYQGNLKSFLQSLVKIYKLGKIFDDIAFIIYFLYDNKIKTISDVQCKPRKVLLLDVPKVRELIESEWREMISRKCLWFNNKEWTGDDFGSAFLTIKPSQLHGLSLDVTTLMNEV